MKNSKRQRRSIITVVIILTIAIGGLLAINTDSVDAERNINQTGAGDTDLAAKTLTTSALPALLRMVSALVVVIICIYGAILLLKHFMGRRYSKSGHLRILEVLETAYVAPKKTVSLIRVADKSVLVGVTENGMSVLTELSPEQTTKVLTHEEEPQIEDNFANSFTNAWDRLRQTASFRRNNKAALDS